MSNIRYIYFFNKFCLSKHLDKQFGTNFFITFNSLYFIYELFAYPNLGNSY